VKFEGIEKKLFGWLGLFVFTSGATLFIFSHWVRVVSPIGEQHHPLEQYIRALHSTLTYLVVLVVGYLVKSHIVPGLKSKKKQRVRSGLTIIFTFTVLLITALLMLYASENRWNSYISNIHGILGLLTPAIIGTHLLSRLKARQVKKRGI
jgi:cytochrome b561